MAVVSAYVCKKQWRKKNLTAEVLLWEGRVRAVGQRSLPRLRFARFLPGTVSGKLGHFAACLGSANCFMPLRVATYVLGTYVHARHGLNRNPLVEGVRAGCQSSR